MTIELIIKIIVFLPLLTFLLSNNIRDRYSNNSGSNKSYSNYIVNIITVIGLLITASLSIFIFIKFHHIEVNKIIIPLFNWIKYQDINIEFALRLDSLSALMLIVVNIVSLVVHIYSIGYMKTDINKNKFMSFLSLFTFFMMLLITSNNILQLFIGWEGVGVSSYLLIGFWHKKATARTAAIKAFMVNRVADLFFILAIIITFIMFHSFDFDTIFANIDIIENKTLNIIGINFNILTIICLFYFIGAMGKSAQIGFHVWLPDAMEGPTPVSALIHAATMVTAGIFLISRLSYLFEYSPIILDLITIIGAFTAIFAALTALTQNDIKKVIAYSTCSQLGYMVFVCGLSAYSAAMFHLATHAFFKALLFLCAGNIIHSTSHQQDIRKMGGLFRRIPLTYIMFVIASLSLSGIIPLSGYFSKDLILEIAAVSDRNFANFAYYIGVITAFLTAFYSFRLIYLVFHEQYRGSAESAGNIHEAPVKTMLMPLSILLLGSIFAGYIGHDILFIDSPSENFWKNSLFIKDENILNDIHHIENIKKYLPMLLSLIAGGLGFLLYKQYKNILNFLSKNFVILFNLSKNKFYFDEIYNIIIIKPIQQFANILYITDIKIIDGLAVEGSSKTLNRFSIIFNKLYNKVISSYAMLIIFSIMIFILLFLLKI